MEKSRFWNDAAKYGVLLGVTMSGKKILQQGLILNGGVENIGWISLQWVLFAVLYFVILFRATKHRASQADPVVGFSFGQGVSYMILVSVLAAVPVSCIYYIYINSIVGYETYVESLISMMITAVEMQPVDSATADTVEMLIDQIRATPQASIFSELFSTIFQHTFTGAFVGLLLAGRTLRRPQIFDKKDE